MSAKMRVRKYFNGREPSGGFSMIELLTVISIILIIAAVGLPQLVASRRLIRSAGMTRDIMTQLRFARQEAMSQRRAMTLSYNDSTKQLSIIRHAAPTTDLATYRTAIQGDAAYPFTVGSSTIRTLPLGAGSVPTSEVSYGIPSGLPVTPLDDTATLTALVNNRVSVTFLPDGSATNNANATKIGLFFYNPAIPSKTATAITVLGSGGRVKVWRYNSSGNKYYE